MKLRRIFASAAPAAVLATALGASASAAYRVCSYDDCTQTGVHYHDGTAYCAGGSDCSGSHSHAGGHHGGGHHGGGHHRR